MIKPRLTPNQLAFLALSNEYCQVVETVAQSEREDFVRQMLRLLPRIYISATDLADPVMLDEEAYIPSVLTEEYYDAARRAMEMVLGEYDTYLEVFEEDMKYSDTPIAASIAEGLADIFQVLYNLTDNVKDATDEVIEMSLGVVKEDFTTYWSKPLCNVLRALNAIEH